MLTYILNGVYILIWLLLLIHCLKRKEFYPLIGTGLGTKFIWLVTFCFFEPFLTLLYFIFGFIMKPPSPDKPSKVIYPGSIIALALIIVGFSLFVWNPKFSHSEPVIISNTQQTDETDKKNGDFKGHAALLESSNNCSTTTSSHNSGVARFKCESVNIICLSNHLLMDKVARLMQADLSKTGYIKQIAFYPEGTMPEKTGTLADITVTIDMTKIKERNLPLGRTLEVNINCQAGTSLPQGSSHSTYDNSPPIVDFKMDIRFDHKSKMDGFETASAKYSQQAQNIAKEITESLKKQFDQFIEKHGLMPELPDFLYGKFSDVQDLPFLDEKNPDLLSSGAGLLTNNLTIWSFNDQRPNIEIFKEISDHLKQSGWHGGQTFNEEENPLEHFSMDRGNEHINIFRMRLRNPDTDAIIYGDSDKLESKPPIIVRYKSLFTNEQIDEVMAKLLEMDNDLETLLIFKHVVRRDNKNKLISILQEKPALTMQGHLLLADYWADEGQNYKARQAVMYAKAMGRTLGDHNPGHDEIKKIAKKIGDKDFTEAEIDEELIQKVGFIKFDQIEDGSEFKKDLSDPLLLYHICDEKGIITLSITVTKTLLSDSEEKLHMAPYSISKVLKDKNSSHCLRETFNADVQIVPVFDKNLTGDYRRPPQITIKKLPDERFIFTFEKPEICN